MNVETENYKIISDNEYGAVQIQIFNYYNSSILEVIKYYGVTSILLSKWKGWKTQSLDFLALVQNLKVLAIFDSEIQDLSVIERLQNLEVLYLECPKARTKINFKLLGKLVDIRFCWRPCFSSIFESNTIQTMVVNSYKPEDLSLFNSYSLSRLDIVKGGSLVSLHGIEGVPNIKILSLYQCNKLVDISSLQTTPIEYIEFESCKNIDVLESVFKFSTLKGILLDKCSHIKNINGISKLELDSLIIRDTVIDDGNLTELLELKCANLFFDKKALFAYP